MKTRYKIFPDYSLGRNAFVQSSLPPLFSLFCTFLYLICSLGPLGEMSRKLMTNSGRDDKVAALY